jgi:Fur family zinc uptake transcriptional regulator
MPVGAETSKTDERLRTAEKICAAHGVRLTALRRRTLEALLKSGEPVKAYELIETMRESGKRLTPATIYRILDFLLRHGLIHRVNALNAYVICADMPEEHHLLMLVCPNCQKTTEINDPAIYKAMFKRLGELGFNLDDGSVEVHGVCRDCAGR